MEKKGRRSFLEITTAFIGGVLSLAAGIPLIGFAISPAFKKGESKWVDLGLADRLKNSRFKKVDYTFTAKDGWVKATKKTLCLRDGRWQRRVARLFADLFTSRLSRPVG